MPERHYCAVHNCTFDGMYCPECEPWIGAGMNTGADLGKGAKDMRSTPAGFIKSTDEFDQTKQFETIAAINRYSSRILGLTGMDDIRPSTAKELQSLIARMSELAKQLYTRS